MSTERLQALFKEIVAQAKSNPSFARRLEAALSDTPGAGRTRRSNRRAPGVLDPFVLYQSGEAYLRDRLAGLSLEQLKDIVAEHGMDLNKLALKWKKTERLIALILDTVSTRSRKGDAFRQRPGS